MAGQKSMKAMKTMKVKKTMKGKKPPTRMAKRVSAANPEAVMKKVAECMVIPVVGIKDVAHTVPLCKALVAGGINIIEIVYRTECALEAMKKAVAEGDGICVGAGTVLTVKQAADALDVGVAFIVSPGFDEAVARLCKRRGALYLPGCVTPTEVMTASSKYNLKTLKFFPAGNYGGLGTLKSFADVFSSVSFMPTGGVSEANVGQFLALPNVVACGGSWITKDMKTCADSGDWSSITELAKKARSAAGGQ